MINCFLQRKLQMKTPCSHSSALTNDKGFTLVEIIAVLVILGVLAAVAIPRVVSLDASAVEKSMLWAVKELNSRESLSWSRIKISDGNWVSDPLLFAATDHDLGAEYGWGSKTIGGGTILFRGRTIALERLASTSFQPGVWKVK